MVTETDYGDWSPPSFQGEFIPAHNPPTRKANWRRHDGSAENPAGDAWVRVLFNHGGVGFNTADAYCWTDPAIVAFEVVEDAFEEGTPDWHTKPQPDLELAIRTFKQYLPGWWYSVCECQVSCDATCAPTSESPDIEITHSLPAGSIFDAGFTADLRQPSTLAEALLDVMDQALAAKALHAGGVGTDQAGDNPDTSHEQASDDAQRSEPLNSCIEGAHHE